jgi:hypothetical protein
MASKGLFAGAPVAVVVAGSLTALTWWLLSLATPDAPPDVGETAIVFVIFYALTHVVRRLLRRGGAGDGAKGADAGEGG